jgi:hypothetical protein
MGAIVVTFVHGVGEATMRLPTLRLHRHERLRRWAGWPWLISIFIHGAALLLGMQFTLGAASRDEEAVDATHMLLAPFETVAAPPPEPVREAPAQPPGGDGANEAIRLETLEPDAALETIPPAPAPGVEAPPPPTTILPPISSSASPVTFAGVTARKATRVTFVIDASGSTVGTLPAVIDELERALRRMTADQRFRVLFFQRNSVVEPGPGKLAAVTPERIDRVLAWARTELSATGRSNPLAALESALAEQPDAIFLMSTPITGAGEFEISADEILRRIDRLNPVGANGRRRVQIQCLQLLESDPDETLKRIAAAHGGEGAFRFVSRADLGLDRR